jgi:hypothetical protein
MRIATVYHDALSFAPAAQSVHAESLGGVMSGRGEMSSAEIERWYPYTSRVIKRTYWETSEHLSFNEFRGKLTNDYRCGAFNEIETWHFPRQEQAAKFTDFIRAGRYHRIRRNSAYRASQGEVALEWMRICDERQEIMAWGRAEKGRLMEVVQSYRFARREGRPNVALDEAAKTVTALDATIGDPRNYAGVLIEWAEREHRDWFWRCCLKHHVL